MVQSVCEKIVLSGIRKEYIESEKKDEYLYGMNMFINVCINIASMLIIGILTGMLWECIVFCAVYKIIRKYTGGFHFESSWLCYVSSCIMYLVAMAAIVYIPFKIFEISAIVLFSSIILWVLSPVEAVNKPLDDCEKRVFKKRSRINIAIMFLMYVICLFISNELAYVISIGIISVMLFAVAGKIKNIAHKEKK